MKGDFVLENIAPDARPGVATRHRVEERSGEAEGRGAALCVW
jgi:hypothetical protein